MEAPAIARTAPDFLRAEDVVVRSILARAAASLPDAPFVSFFDGTAWSRAEGLRQAYGSAYELRRAGLRQGDTVVAAVPNGPAYLRTWWGAAMLGAVVVPVNPESKGLLVNRVLEVARPRVIVACDQFRRQLSEVGLHSATSRILDGSEIVGLDDRPPPLDRPIESWDPIAFIMTSGTTGPSKVVRMTYAHSGHNGWMIYGRHGIGADDVYICDVSLAHSAGFYAVHGALMNGTQVAIRERPDLAAYWEVARDARATLSQLYSTMISYLESQPSRGSERSHHLRTVVTVPFPSDPKSFSARFGIPRLASGWGITEIGCGIGSTAESKLVAGAAGRLFPGWDVRLVDEHDREVPAGAAGEAIVRSDTPWLITTEYVGDPSATARAWRNGWFHTGDLLRVDEDGDFFFLDRANDAIRRRGENIPSFEVESAVESYPGIAEAAAVAAPSDIEDEVKVWLLLEPGVEDVDWEALLLHCAANLPHSMVPRYFEIAAEFPKNALAKIQKNVLRQRGSGENTWDRVAHGYEVTRRGIVRELAVDT